MPDQAGGPDLPEVLQALQWEAALSPGGTAMPQGLLPSGSEGQNSAGQGVELQAVRGDTRPFPPGECADGRIRLLLAAWASLTREFCAEQLRLPSPTSANLAHLLISPPPPAPPPATPTRPDAVQARLDFGEPLQPGPDGVGGKLGYSWMLVPSLLGPSVRAGP